MKRFIVMSAAVLALAACDNGDKPAASGAGSAAPAAAEKPMTDQEIESAELPVEADFEEEAAAAITSDTLDDQVAALENEINGDKGE